MAPFGRGGVPIRPLHSPGDHSSWLDGLASVTALSCSALACSSHPEANAGLLAYETFPPQGPFAGSGPSRGSADHLPLSQSVATLCHEALLWDLVQPRQGASPPRSFRIHMAVMLRWPPAPPPCSPTLEWQPRAPVVLATATALVRFRRRVDLNDLPPPPTTLSASLAGLLAGVSPAPLTAPSATLSRTHRLQLCLEASALSC